MGQVIPNVGAGIQQDVRTIAETACWAGIPSAADEATTCGRPGTARTRHRLRRLAHQRHGVVALWLILTLPVLLLLLIFLIEVGNIWLARAELENALEASALAAVKEWGDSTGAANLAARNVGVTYAAANTVTGTSVAITNNHGGAAPNLNAAPTGNLIFGAVTTSTIPWVFNSSEAVDSAGEFYGVRAQATVPVNSVVGSLGGYTVPAFSVSATATARYASPGNRPELIRVRPENFL
jgi:Flp pilus assembly protein TadG